MEREKFMQEARRTAHQILEGKENGIMNLVQRAWAEGKRNAEVETLREAIDEALDRREPKAELKEDAVYPTWAEFLHEAFCERYPMPYRGDTAWYAFLRETHIPADIAEKLSIEPRGES